MIQTLALFIIAICLILIARRNLVVGLISLAAILAMIILFYISSDDERADSVLLTSVNLSQTRISSGYANSFVLNARIKNNHRAKFINTLKVRSTLSDCKTNQTDCLNIGEEDNRIKVRIPPGQARDVEINLRIQHLDPMQGTASWQHQVISVQ